MAPALHFSNFAVTDPARIDNVSSVLPAAVPLRSNKGPGVSVPPTLVFAAALAAGVWWNARMSWPLATGSFVDPLEVAGAIGVAFGMVLFAAGMATFAKARTGIMLQQAATKVVASGPYRWSRNPQYVGFVAIYAGACLLMNTVWPLLLLPVVIVLTNRLVIAREERYMRQTFGDAYQAYSARVPRWL